MNHHDDPPDRSRSTTAALPEKERIEREKEALPSLSFTWSVFVRIREVARNADLALAGALSGMLLGLLAALSGLPEMAETADWHWAVYALASAAGLTTGGAVGRGLDEFLAGIGWSLGRVRWFFEPTVNVLRDRLEALARGSEPDQCETPAPEPPPAPAARPRTASLSDKNRARATDASEEEDEGVGPLAKV